MSSAPTSIGTGRAADREKALDFERPGFVDLDNEALEDVGGVDLGFDVIGGESRAVRSPDSGRRNAVSVVGPTEARPTAGLAIDFVVESDRAQLTEVVQRVRDGRLRTNIGNVATLDDARCGPRSTRPSDEGKDDHPRTPVGTPDGNQSCPPRRFSQPRGSASRHVRAPFTPGHATRIAARCMPISERPGYLAV